jgi:F-type H+-transporting ATPase subunit b
MIFDPHFFIPVAHAAEEAGKSGLAETLGVNWKLFIAQIINFGIILLVLWKWVFGPVAKGLQARTDKIEKSLNDADRIETEKKEFENWRTQELSKVKIQASEIITSAQLEANKAKQTIAEQTKEEQQKLIDQAKHQIESDKNKSISEAKTELANLVTNATEKILRKKLDAKTDHEFIKESLVNIK